MSQNALKKLSRVALTLVVMSALASCKTLEIAHAPLSCLGYPEMSLSDRMSYEELNSMSDDAFNQVEAHIISYQVRIDSQCEMIKHHNREHNK